MRNHIRTGAAGPAATTTAGPTALGRSLLSNSSPLQRLNAVCLRLKENSRPAIDKPLRSRNASSRGNLSSPRRYGIFFALSSIGRTTNSVDPPLALSRASSGSWPVLSVFSSACGSLPRWCRLFTHVSSFRCKGCALVLHGSAVLALRPREWARPTRRYERDGSDRARRL